MADISSPTLTGEATLGFIRHAATRVRRGVLFIPGSHSFAGMAEFGIDIAGGRVEEHVRRLAIPRDHPSILSDVTSKRGTYRGLLPHSFWNDYLVKELGGRLPREVIVVPAVVGGDVMAIFYGDNLPSETAIGPMGDVEMALTYAWQSRARAGVNEHQQAAADLSADPNRSASS
jgi:hypothetical protein